MVYKLVDINNVPKLKLSEELEKTTLPGEKQVIRVYGDGDRSLFDFLCLATELAEVLKHNDASSPLTVCEPFTDKTHTVTPKRVEALSELLFEGGKIIKPMKQLTERR